MSDVRALENELKALSESVRTLRRIVAVMGVGVVAAIVLALVYVPSTLTVEKIEFTGSDDGSRSAHVSDHGLFLRNGKTKTMLSPGSLMLQEPVDGKDTSMMLLPERISIENSKGRFSLP